MQDNCSDIFKAYNLPFETYFLKCAVHKTSVHDHIELIWVIRGKATVICDGEQFELSDQNVFVIYMHKVHEIYAPEDSIIISYRLKHEHLLLNKMKFDQIPFKQKVYSFQELSAKYHQVPLLITQILKLLMNPSDKSMTRYKIIGYYNLFIYALYNFLLKEKYLDVKNKNYDPYLVRLHVLIDYISSHAHEQISLEEMSQMVHLSRYRLSHFFKEAIGISFSEFLQNTRLEKALHYLSETDMPVSEVASLSGFSDIKYLNQMIKERFQMTALKYRKWMHVYHEKIDLTSTTSEFIDELNDCLNAIIHSKDFHDTYGLKQNKSTK